jgi:hypothetical protein
MRSSRTKKGTSYFRHICLRECVQEQTMWHCHIGTVKGMQRMRPYRLGACLQYAHGVAK